MTGGIGERREREREGLQLLPLFLEPLLAFGTTHRRVVTAIEEKARKRVP